MRLPPTLAPGLAVLGFALVAAALPRPAGAQIAPYDASGMTFGHVHLNVSDVAASAKMWHQQFGGVVEKKGPLTVVKWPDLLLILNQRKPTSGSMATVLDHFGFKVRNLKEHLDRWKAAGYEVQAEFTGAEGFPNAYLMAPDSLRIELQQDPAQSEDVVGYHVHFFTPDYEHLLDWYIDTFGVKRFKRGSIATTANAPGMNLSFGNSRTPRVGSQGSPIDHIGFEFRDLDAFVKTLEAKGIELDMQPREIPAIGLKIAFLTDPDGGRIELTQGLDAY